MKLSIVKKLQANDNSRSGIVKRNVAGSAVLKIVNVLISLIVVPLTINYVSADRYGIWLTLSSIIAWVSYFDFGLGHGFRNRFTEALAKDNTKLARELVSTTYVTLAAIFTVILIIVLIINRFLNWGNLLNISTEYNPELTQVFALLAICFCSNCIVNTFNMLLIANQKTAMASLVQTITQIGGLIGILVVTNFAIPSLLWLAIAYTLVPSIILILISLYAYTFTSYRQFCPKLRFFRVALIKDIIGLGGKFFIIMLSTLFIFQCVNIVISRTAGPMEVTEYNIAYKYFNITHMGFVIVLIPFWSAFTDAYVKQDCDWMRKMLKKLELAGIMIVVAIVFMACVAKFIIKLWIGDSFMVPVPIIIAVGLYMVFLNFSGIYMYLINGIGKVSLQMYVYCSFALVSIPLMIYLGHNFGVPGIIAIPSLVYLTQAIIGRIQLGKLINNTATGIWNK